MESESSLSDSNNSKTAMQRSRTSPKSIVGKEMCAVCFFSLQHSLGDGIFVQSELTFSGTLIL